MLCGDLQTSQMRIKFLTDSNLFSASSCATCIASASSIYTNDIEKWGPQLTLDEKNAPGRTGFFHSSLDELQPWLQIEFPNEKKISSVEIANR
jgi:hypothetical protein